MGTALMFGIPVLCIAAAGALALRRPNYATAVFVVAAIVLGALAVRRPLIFGDGLFFVLGAAICVVVAILINEPLYKRIVDQPTRRRDEKALQYVIIVERMCVQTSKLNSVHGLQRAADYEWARALALPRWQRAGVTQANAPQKLAESRAGIDTTGNQAIRRTTGPSPRPSTSPKDPPRNGRHRL